MKYLIFADVSTDVDVSAINTENVRFLPMEYSLGSEMRKCTAPETRENLKLFYDSQRNGDLTKTSQISPYLYEEYLTPAFKEGYSALCLCLSSGLSSTFQSAMMAKENLEEQYPGQLFMPVDTLAATGGMGVLLERAVRNMEKGMSLEENFRDLNDGAAHIRHWFLVQDLMYLKRGGRISGATAVLGTALNIVPILKINEIGKLDTFAKKRGTKVACKELVRNFNETYDPASGDVIYVIDADASATADILQAEVEKLYPTAVIRRCGLSPIIGAHTGPGMAAICHMGK